MRRNQNRRAVLLLLGAYVAGCGGAAGEPRFVIESQIIDFGVLPREGKPLEIPITNGGDAPLAIYNVSTSCACQIVEVPSAIAPGETKMVVVRPPAGQQGPMSSRIVVQSNDKSGPHEFQLSWFGESPPALDPPRILVHNARPGELIERRVQATYSGGESLYALNVESVECSDPAFDLDVLQSDLMAKQSGELTSNRRPIIGETTFLFRCQLPEETGVVRGTCTVLATQAKQTHRLVLPVEIDVTGPLSTLGSFFFSAGTPSAAVGQKRRVVLNVRGDGQEPVVVERPDSVRCSLSRLSDTGETKLYALEAEILEAPNAPEVKSQVVVRIAEDDQSRISIPLTIVSLR